MFQSSTSSKSEMTSSSLSSPVRPMSATPFPKRYNKVTMRQHRAAHEHKYHMSRSIATRAKSLLFPTSSSSSRESISKSPTTLLRIEQNNALSSGWCSSRSIPDGNLSIYEIGTNNEEPPKRRLSQKRQHSQHSIVNNNNNDKGGFSRKRHSSPIRIAKEMSDVHSIPSDQLKLCLDQSLIEAYASSMHSESSLCRTSIVSMSSSQQDDNNPLMIRGYRASHDLFYHRGSSTSQETDYFQTSQDGAGGGGSGGAGGGGAGSYSSQSSVYCRDHLEYMTKLINDRNSSLISQKPFNLNTLEENELNHYIPSTQTQRWIIDHNNKPHSSHSLHLLPFSLSGNNSIATNNSPPLLMDEGNYYCDEIDATTTTSASASAAGVVPTTSRPWSGIFRENSQYFTFTDREDDIEETARLKLRQSFVNQTYDEWNESLPQDKFVAHRNHPSPSSLHQHETSTLTRMSAVSQSFMCLSVSEQLERLEEQFHRANSMRRNSIILVDQMQMQNDSLPVSTTTIDASQKSPTSSPTRPLSPPPPTPSLITQANQYLQQSPFSPTSSPFQHQSATSKGTAKIFGSNFGFDATKLQQPTTAFVTSIGNISTPPQSPTPAAITTGTTRQIDDKIPELRQLSSALNNLKLVKSSTSSIVVLPPPMTPIDSRRSVIDLAKWQQSLPYTAETLPRKYQHRKKLMDVLPDRHAAQKSITFTSNYSPIIPHPRQSSMTLLSSSQQPPVQPISIVNKTSSAIDYHLRLATEEDFRLDGDE